MRERYQLALKIACAVLAAVLLFQLGRVTFRRNPLTRLKIPDLPALASTNDATAAGKATNNVAGSAGAKGNTNNVGKQPGTNTALVVPPSDGSGSNKPRTNVPPVIATAKNGTNLQESATTQTGSNLIAESQSTTAGTNGLPATLSTNAGSNLIARAESGTNATARTNLATAKKGKGPGGGPEMAMMGGGPPGRGSKKGPDLPPAIQARVDKITDSEILGPVIRPQPMALMGIVGNVALLRAPNGQTGVVKEGDEVGGLKLLRIGTNRVLVEKEGQKSELMIFSGYGSESIMPKETDKTNEPPKKP